MWLPAVFFRAFACIMPLGRLGLIDDIKYEEQLLETSFETNVRVEATVSYPRLPETSFFKCYVNENVKRDSLALYDAYIQKMGSLQQDVGEEEELNERTLHYDLQPVYCSLNLISLYGSEHQYAGGAHGSVHYITRTFWQNDGVIRELSLDDLFLSEYRKQLFRYCENYFKSNQCGYYCYDDYSWVGFGPEHLDAFLLTKKGLLLLFQNYVVSGFDDFPTTLLIPYPFLDSIANPDGPLPALMKTAVH
ncbi:MAG: hypothetical protein HW387_149 [Parachlamydiales bacterium]|nr:hypothetical protein [Parachlamydiales bacterium]